MLLDVKDLNVTFTTPDGRLLSKINFPGRGQS